jgi:hypothetical protein
VRLTFHYQHTLWEAVRTGVALGAEEVQDQRLAAAETPPEANPGLDVFLFILLWAFEAPLAAGLLGAVRGMMVRGLKRQMRLQARAYRQLLAAERPALDEARRIAAQRVGRERIYRAGLSEQELRRNQQAQAAVQDAAAALRELDRAERRFPSPQALSARSGLGQTALAL